jgi:phospholipase C
MTPITDANDQARRNLDKIDHFIVLMLENRSFDQMLGHLECEGHDVDGLKQRANKPELVNLYNGREYRPKMAGRTALTEAEDPCHSGWCVAEQLSNDNGCFVENFAAVHPGANPQLVMDYYTANQVPVYNWLGKHFCVCDRWFCSVPGATWPNRLYAVAGTAAGSLDNKLPPLYSCMSFIRRLDEVKKPNVMVEPSWGWYSSDPGTLRFIDHYYFPMLIDEFAYFDKPSMFQQRTFLHDAAEGNLPSFSWIDPNFVDLGGLTGANDDHPPADVMAGQELVFKVYNAVATSPHWERTLLVIVYDEHGGFYDHVSPPSGLPEKDPKFTRYGPRVPAIVVSPWVEPKQHSHIVFDHTSIIKTALLRFCGSNAESYIKDMGPRVEQANHLGELLTRQEPRKAQPLNEKRVIASLIRWREREIRRRLLHPLADEPSIISVDEAVETGKGVLHWLWNGVTEPVLRRLDRQAKLLEPSKSSLRLLEKPRHEFEQSMFAGGSLFREEVKRAHP